MAILFQLNMYANKNKFSSLHTTQGRPVLYMEDFFVLKNNYLSLLQSKLLAVILAVFSIGRIYKKNTSFILNLPPKVSIFL